MEDQEFLTLASKSQGIYKEKGSKFIAYAFPVGNLDKIGEQLGILKITHPDATHHCFAYILGINKEEYRSFDDGEPKHSAGDPILGQIRSRELTDVLVVVVRYFGGTKLGVSGLVKAYRIAAADALDNNQIISKQVTRNLKLIFPYQSTNLVTSILKENGIQITGQQFGQQCEAILEVPESKLKNFLDRVEALGLEVRTIN